MTKRMLIDATHAEETRVVVLDGNRLEDFDVETSTKRQLKGNIYLAKVVRVEPSLQAAFVEYGGNRHGFLAFSEIHPDYYQIPVADRQRLLEMQAEEARREEEEDDLELALAQAVRPEPASAPEPAAASAPPASPAAPQAEAWASPATPLLTVPESAASLHSAQATPAGTPEPAGLGEAAPQESPATETPAAEMWAVPSTPSLMARPQQAPADAMAREADTYGRDSAASDTTAKALAIPVDRVVGDEDAGDDAEPYDLNGDTIEVLPPPETIGGQDGDSGEDHRERRIPPRFLRNYKIQEVIRRRQIMLVQVVKEERGTKGAALTTYLSLAGRFGVLMPNSPRGGGISRKITSAADRRRLREVIEELDIPRGMGLIVRTAGANRPKPEIKRDCEYLLRLWDDIREHTLKSVAPALIYEEASLIKRAIRDVYSRDIDEILVDGEEGWRAAHEFMRMLMPSHAKKVQLWRDGGQPLFARNQVEAQLDAMLMPIVQLRSGGYLVINQAEALVAIDVNSGRSTRERNIEETALRTNLEAADEVARQLRLRDLAGLVVIDFIDMESKRHNAMVERRLKEALKNDRARIQVGHISHFGLLEMSRQRLRPSLAETSFIACPHCGGTGHVRSTESSAIHVLRGIEEEGAKRRSAEIIVHVSTPVALYLLNHKRERLREIELRYTMRVIVAADDSQIAPQFRIEKVRVRAADEIPPVVSVDRPLPPSIGFETEVEEEEEADVVGLEEDEDDTEDDTEATEEARSGDTAGEDAERRRKRRRRRRRGSRRDEASGSPDAAGAEEAEGAGEAEAPVEAEAPASVETPREAEAEADAQPEAQPEAATPALIGAEPVTIVAETVTETLETAEPTASAEEEARARRRGRRGGRRRRRDGEGELSPFALPGADQPDIVPAYAGPTPADPFGGQVFDIFDVMDRVERAAESQPARRTPSVVEIVNTPAPEPEPVPAAPEPEAAAMPAAEAAAPGTAEAAGAAEPAADTISEAHPPVEAVQAPVAPLPEAPAAEAAAVPEAPVAKAAGPAEPPTPPQADAGTEPASQLPQEAETATAASAEPATAEPAAPAQVATGEPEAAPATAGVEPQAAEPTPAEPAETEPQPA
ncbi:MAG TPA: Rne/Rng family ribonuclease, partial [Rhodopila sp.]|nr:Rne/Rng family ribonuclease [Rhodopila sp.]